MPRPPPDGPLEHGSPGIALAIVPDGRLASGEAEDGKIKLWLADEQELVAALCRHAGRNLTTGSGRATSAPTLPEAELPRPPLELVGPGPVRFRRVPCSRLPEPGGCLSLCSLSALLPAPRPT